jgi:type IV pilus assembly protein PilA
MLKVQRNSKGFTLIELLIVIAIIGILAAIAIPAYTGYTRKAKVQEVITSMGAVKTACTAFYTESGAGILLNQASDPALINSVLGVDVPVKYLAGYNPGPPPTATGMVVTETAAGGSVITTTLGTAIGGDTDGKTIILSSGVDYKQWTWGGTLPVGYMPKN